MIVIPTSTPVLAVEVGVGRMVQCLPWAKMQVFSLDQFGRGKAADVAEYFGFTPENLVVEAKNCLIRL